MEIPLFPLHTVLCPGIVLPLHVFEDRYRALTRHCLETGEPFGVVLIREGREVGLGQPVAGRRRRPRRDPRGGPVPGRPLRPPRRGDRPVRDRVGRSRATAVSRRRRDAARGRGRRRDDRRSGWPRRRSAASSATSSSCGRATGETSEVLDIRVELDSSEATRSPATRPARRRCRPSKPVEIDDDTPGIEADATTMTTTRTRSADARRRNLVIPDDPTVLSYLLSGIVQVELAAASGTARGRHDDRPARGPDPPPRP